MCYMFNINFVIISMPCFNELNNLELFSSPSDEELCQLVETSKLPQADEQGCLKPNCGRSVLSEKEVSYSHIRNCPQIHWIDSHKPDVQLETESTVTNNRGTSSCNLKYISPPCVVTVSDSDSIVSVSSSDNQFEIINSQSKSPATYAGKPSHSVTPTQKSNIQSTLNPNCKDILASGTLRCGGSWLQDNSFGKSGGRSQSLHRFGHVEAWKKELPSSTQVCNEQFLFITRPH